MSTFEIVTSVLLIIYPILIGFIVKIKETGMDKFVKDMVQVGVDFNKNGKNDILEVLSLALPSNFGKLIEGEPPKPDPQVEEIFRMLGDLMVKIEEIDAKLINHIDETKPAEISP